MLLINRGFHDAFLGDSVPVRGPRSNEIFGKICDIGTDTLSLISLSLSLFHAFWYKRSTLSSRGDHESTVPPRRTMIIHDYRINIIVYRTESSHVMRTPKNIFSYARLSYVRVFFTSYITARRRAFSFVLYLKRKRSIHCCHCLYTKAYYH